MPSSVRVAFLLAVSWLLFLLQNELKAGVGKMRPLAIVSLLTTPIPLVSD